MQDYILNPSLEPSRNSPIGRPHLAMKFMVAWFKQCTSIHEILAKQLCKYVQVANIQEWMIKRKFAQI